MNARRATAVVTGGIAGFCLLWVVLALCAPVLAASGAIGAATFITRIQRIGCNQIPSHSVYVCGHPMGLCARHTALYGLLAATVLFDRCPARLRGIAPALALLSLVPMAADVGLSWVSVWAPTLITRLGTGATAGLGLGTLLVARGGATARREMA